MAGNATGGMKAAEKNLGRDPQFYRRIGSIGGRNGRGTAKGFASYKTDSNGLTGRQRAHIVGSIGGRISRRTKKVSHDA